MKPEEIQEIVQVLSVDLPPAYVDMVCPYSFSAESSLAQYAMPDSKDWLIQLNQGLRTNGWDGAVWPHHFLVFGHDGGHCYYFFDLSQDDDKVHIISKEGCAIEDAAVYAPTLKAYADAELEADEELNETMQQEEAQPESKQWWELF